MKFSKFIVDAFSSTESVSSKRLFGGLGFMIGSAVIIYDTVVNKKISDVFEVYFITSASLVGLDSITGIWKGKYPINKDSQKSNTNLNKLSHE